MLEPSFNLSRRNFTRSLGATAAIFCGLEAFADDKAEQGDRDRKVEPSLEKNSDDRAEDSPALPEIDELLIQVIARQFPHSRLTPQALQQIQADIRSDLHRSKTLSSFPLRNSDEPASTFAAWRQDQSY